MTGTKQRQLEIDGISKRYGDLVALEDLTFDVRAGELFGFVGRNGAGKTTTMRIALGVLSADAGVVRWLGVPLTFEARRRIGYMPEERGLYPRMHVAEQLAYLGELHGMTGADARGAALGWLDRFGLADRRDADLQALSLGNQQRVQLAAALVFGPDVLVLDEPFAGLDPVAVDVMAGVLRERADAGVPVIFSSHELELVERLCDRVGIIDHGRMVACGTVDELRAGGPRAPLDRRPRGPGRLGSRRAGRATCSRPTARGGCSSWIRASTTRRCSRRRWPPDRCARSSASSPPSARSSGRSSGRQRHECAACAPRAEARRLPTIVLVARREIRMRLRSRVFVGGTTVMAVLVVVGIVAASLLAGRTNPVRVGFSGGSQALERAFTATAAALGANVTVSDIADVTAGEAQVTAGTLDVLVTGSSTAPTAVVKDCHPVDRRVRPVPGRGGGTPFRRRPLTGGRHLGHGPGPGPAPAAPQPQGHPEPVRQPGPRHPALDRARPVRELGGPGRGRGEGDADHGDPARHDPAKPAARGQGHRDRPRRSPAAHDRGRGRARSRST